MVLSKGTMLPVATTSDVIMCDDKDGGDVGGLAEDNITSCVSTTDDMVHKNDPPAKRKRRAQQRPDFVQMDDFTAAKKPKRTSTSKKGTEEEFATTWICVECKEAECMMEPDATELLICDGVCRRVFHYPCAGLSELPPDDIPFICNDCTNQKHICSLCSNYGFDNEDVYKCSKSNCGMFYHESCLSMRNIEVAMISKDSNGVDDEDFVLNNAHDDDDDNDQAVDLNVQTNASKSLIERRFVCPAHSCWTCTQVDLKDERQQPDVVDDTKPTKSNKKKKKVGGSFDTKKESFLTRCLECPIAYHVTCIPPSANFHELATLCHEHSTRCKLPHLDPNDSLQVKIESKIDEKFGEHIKKEHHRKLKKGIGQNPFLPNISGTALTTSESDVLTALLNHENKGNAIATMPVDQGWFCLPCDLKDEVHSKLPTYKHVHSLKYDPNHKPPRIQPQDDICTCTNMCDENCINRMLYTECFGNTKNVDTGSHTKNGTMKSSNCAVGSNCGNRQIGQRLMAKCKPQREQGKGWGLVLLKNAFQGSLIQEYIGEVVDEAMKEKRLNEWYNEHPNDPNFYLMALQPGWFIDARDVANLSRFINHSCDPNCVLQQINVHGRMRCGIFAIRDIAAGEFLSYDYHFDTRHGDRFICCCGSDNCRGTMKGGKDSGLAPDVNNTSRKSKGDIWDAAKASYERDRKFLMDYEEDRMKRCTQVGAIVPGGDTDEHVANGAQENKYRSDGQQQRIFLWRNIVLGNNFERRFAKLCPAIVLNNDK